MTTMYSGVASDTRHPTSCCMRVMVVNSWMSLSGEFNDVFVELSRLTPVRTRDHHVHLLLGMAPVAVQPYRNLVAKKGEIEHQCKLMEGEGLIRYSMSTLSSHILLV